MSQVNYNVMPAYPTVYAISLQIAGGSSRGAQERICLLPQPNSSQDNDVEILVVPGILILSAECCATVADNYHVKISFRHILKKGM